MPDVRIEQREGALVVTPAMARLDALVAPDFRNAVLAQLGTQRAVVVSLEQVQFMDSSGLAALISILKRLPAGGELRLAHVNKAIASLLKVTRLDRVLPVFPSVEAALGGSAHPA